jgi:hypothetical protein
MRSVLRSTATRRTLVRKPAEPDVISGWTVEDWILTSGRTAQDASSGNSPLRTTRTRSTSSRKAVICSRRLEARMSIPLGNETQRTGWAKRAGEGKQYSAQSTSVRTHGLTMLILDSSLSYGFGRSSATDVLESWSAVTAPCRLCCSSAFTCCMASSAFFVSPVLRYMRASL